MKGVGFPFWGMKTFWTQMVMMVVKLEKCRCMSCTLQNAKNSEFCHNLKKNVGKKEYSFHSFKAKTLKVVVMIKREKWMRDGCGDTHGQSQPLVN